MAAFSITVSLDAIGRPSLATITTEAWPGKVSQTVRHDLQDASGREPTVAAVRSLLLLLHEETTRPRLALVDDSPGSSG